MKNNFPTFFIQEHPLFFSFSLFNWYLFLAPTLLNQQFASNYQMTTYQ